MITIIESYSLKPEHVHGALEVLQELDCLLGPNAHRNRGHVGHAIFLQDEVNPTEVCLVYDWRDRESFEELLVSEEPLLGNFQSKYCSRPRIVRVFKSIAVET